MSLNKQILIVEDNAILAESMRDYFSLKNEVDVVGVAYNSLEAIEILNQHAPDIIITDIVMPLADGFVLLEYLNKLNRPNKPEVIVLTSLKHDSSIKRASDLGAIFYIAKPFSMEDLHDRVLYALNMQKPEKNERLQQAEDHSVDQHSSALLVSVGIPAQNKGYQYLIVAIKAVIEKPALINGLTTKLYPYIGDKFGTTGSTVERAIRNAVTTAFDSGKLQNINRFCKSDVFFPYYKPANGEFISVAAMIIQNSMDSSSGEGM